MAALFISLSVGNFKYRLDLRYTYEEMAMYVRMVTYDSDYGDEITFDEYIFSVLTFDEFKQVLLTRFDELIRTKTLIINRESGFANLVGPCSGKTAETYVIAYPCEQDAINCVNGIELALGLFYYPDTREISNVFDGWCFWSRFSEIDDHVTQAWGLGDVLENQPSELDTDCPDGPIGEWELTEFLFELYQSRLDANK